MVQEVKPDPVPRADLGTPLVRNLANAVWAQVRCQNRSWCYHNAHTLATRGGREICTHQTSSPRHNHHPNTYISTALTGWGNYSIQIKAWTEPVRFSSSTKKHFAQSDRLIFIPINVPLGVAYMLSWGGVLCWVGRGRGGRTYCRVGGERE
jgi:hypothetical protein